MMRHSQATSDALGKRQKSSATSVCDVDNAVYKWYAQQRSLGISVSVVEIKNAAENFAKALKCGSFKPSENWLLRFLKLYNIASEKEYVKSSDSSELSLVIFKKKLFRIIHESGLQTYQVYNADETELFWKLLPQTTHAYNAQVSGSGRRKGIEKLSVLFASNADGTHRLKPAIVGKSAKRQALQNGMEGQSVNYFYNRTALFTCDIFSKWFHECFVPEVRNFQENVMSVDPNDVKGILLIDSAPIHCFPEMLSSQDGKIKCLLLPESASFVQPMVNGIIHICKRHYRQKQLNDVIVFDGETREVMLTNAVSYDIKIAIYNLAESWKDVKDSTLRNCWNMLFDGLGCIDSTNFDGFQLTDYMNIFKKAGERYVTVEDAKAWLKCDENKPGYQNQLEEKRATEVIMSAEECAVSDKEVATLEDIKLSTIKICIDKILSFLDTTEDCDLQCAGLYKALHIYRSKLDKAQHILQCKIDESTNFLGVPIDEWTESVLTADCHEEPAAPVPASAVADIISDKYDINNRHVLIIPSAFEAFDGHHPNVIMDCKQDDSIVEVIFVEELNSETEDNMQEHNGTEDNMQKHIGTEDNMQEHNGTEDNLEEHSFNEHYTDACGIDGSDLSMTEAMQEPFIVNETCIKEEEKEPLLQEVKVEECFMEEDSLSGNHVENDVSEPVTVTSSSMSEDISETGQYQHSSEARTLDKPQHAVEGTSVGFANAQCILTAGYSDLQCQVRGSPDIHGQPIRDYIDIHCQTTTDYVQTPCHTSKGYVDMQCKSSEKVAVNIKNEHGSLRRNWLMIHMNKYFKQKPPNKCINANFKKRNATRNKIQKLDELDGRLNNGFHNNYGHKLVKETSLAARLRLNKLGQNPGNDSDGFKSLTTKLHKCPHCDYCASYSCHLALHMCKHLGLKPFKCSLCEYKTSRKSNLVVHMHKHLHIEPLRCSQCFYKTISKRNFDLHMQKHLKFDKLKAPFNKHKATSIDAKPFKCMKCDYSSAYKSSLIVHLRKHSGEKPFKCLHCDYKASQKANLNAHLRRNHTDIRA